MQRINVTTTKEFYAINCKKGYSLIISGLTTNKVFLINKKCRNRKVALKRNGYFFYPLDTDDIGFYTDTGTATVYVAYDIKLTDYVFDYTDILTNIYNSLNMIREQINDNFTGAINGQNATFTPSKIFIALTTQIFVNGILQNIGIDYNEVNNTVVFVLASIPQVNDIISFNYHYTI